MIQFRENKAIRYEKGAIRIDLIKKTYMKSEAVNWDVNKMNVPV